MAAGERSTGRCAKTGRRGVQFGMSDLRTRGAASEPAAPKPQGRVEMLAFYVLVLIYVGGGAWTWWQLMRANLG